MRLPVVPDISTKDGVSNKNARLFNTLKESKSSGDKAVVRPGLVLSDTYAGLGNGLIEFDGRLLVIGDDTIYQDDSAPAELDAFVWDGVTVFDFGDEVWYLGDLWFSLESGNSAQTPGVSTSWSRSLEDTNFDPDTVYGIGDTITVNGVTYYSFAPNNQNNYPGNPSSAGLWGKTAPGSSRYRVTVNSIAALNATTPGPECAGVEAAGSAWFATATTFISCATKVTGNWVTHVGVELRTGTYYVRVNQWTDPAPNDCSGTPSNLGIIDGGTITQTV